VGHETRDRQDVCRVKITLDSAMSLLLRRTVCTSTHILRDQMDARFVGEEMR